MEIAQTTPQEPQLLMSRVRSKPSSTLPLQSLSRPSQRSGVGVCSGRTMTGPLAEQALTPAVQMPIPSVPAGPP